MSQKQLFGLSATQGPEALLFSFAYLNPFQPRSLSPAGPTAPSPAVERGQAPGESLAPPPGHPAPRNGMTGNSPV